MRLAMDEYNTAAANKLWRTVRRPVPTAAVPAHTFGCLEACNRGAVKLHLHASTVRVSASRVRCPNQRIQQIATKRRERTKNQLQRTVAHASSIQPHPFDKHTSTLYSTWIGEESIFWCYHSTCVRSQLPDADRGCSREPPKTKQNCFLEPLM